MINKGRSGHKSLRKSLILYFFSRNVLSCWIRTFLLLFVLAFVWIQVTFGNIFWIKNSNKNPLPKDVTIENDSYHKEQLSEKVIKSRSKNNTNEDLGVITIQEKIKKYNEEQKIINEDIFGPLSNESHVIVIQVHNRIIYLKYLIESLSKAKHINEVLLVFSHDVYDEDINMLVRNITFCKVVQIFLPYSIQAHPHEFPGDDPNDCPRDIGKERALKTKCVGAEHPDKYEHYRESKFTQIKHHWWWKANHLFNHLRITKEYTGLVTFLEEDHYVAEDFIYILKILDQKCATIADCYLLGLGYNAKLFREFRDSNQIKMSPLTTNLGLSFNRTTFNIILSCTKQFCEYDDYNWDWSLNYIANTCGKTVLQSLISGGPRVFHTGECGTHIHKSDCKEEIIISKIQNVLRKANDKLYPSILTISDSTSKKPNFVPNGGWGDPRDHELCISMANR